MPAKEALGSEIHEEFVEKSSDRVTRFLGFGVLFLVICLLCLVVYALWIGVFSPPAPRTRLESTLSEASAAVKKNPRSGAAWAALAGAQYLTGDKIQAWDTLARARESVKDRSILLVNGRELDFLITEKKNKEVLKRADGFIKEEAKAQTVEAAANAAKGISVPDQVQNNVDAVRLFVLKASAQGNLGRWKEAVATLDTALELDDKAADIILMRGRAKLKSGDKAGAKKDFERALMFLPNDPTATQGLKEAGGTPAGK